MVLAIAGKSNALVECLRYSESIVEKESICVIPAFSDSEFDTWQYSIKKYCKDHLFKVSMIEDLYNIEDLVLFSIQYDKLIDVNKFKSKKLFNIHFSYLPAYRGMYPIIWPILNQNEYSGVTLHELDWSIDTGDIIDQEKIYLHPDINSRELYEKCVNLAVELFKRNIVKIIDGKFEKFRQPVFYSSYFSKKSIDFSNIKIDFNKTASEISAQFRAFIFSEYQYPLFNEVEIDRVKILLRRSVNKPGTLLRDASGYFIISTLDYDLKLYKSYKNKLFEAIERNDMSSFNGIINLIDNLDEYNNMGLTPLMVSIINRNYLFSKILIKKGANVNSKNYKGESVLFHAIKSTSPVDTYGILDLLIKGGAKLNDNDQNGFSI